MSILLFYNILLTNQYDNEYSCSFKVGDHFQYL